MLILFFPSRPFVFLFPSNDQKKIHKKWSSSGAKERLKKEQDERQAKGR
jgi:hypothetical protein